jgi:lysozyme
MRALDVRGVTLTEAQALLANDLTSIETTLSRTYPWFLDLDPVRQGVLTNLAYNLGLHGLASFRRMLNAIAIGAYANAAAELQDSRWFHQVQQSRSSRLIAQLLTGTLTSEASMSGSFYPNTILGGMVGVNLTITLDAGTRALLAGLLSQLLNLNTRMDAMSGTTDSIAAELANLQASVASAIDTENKAVTLIQGIPALIQAAVDQAVAAGTPPEQLQAFHDLNDQLVAATQPLAQAVASQSPQQPPTP